MQKEKELRSKIKDKVSEYYNEFIKDTSPYKKGDRISYSGRVYDDNEMNNLTDAVLDFWLTSGRFVDEMESKLARYIGVKHARLVNSGSSANLLALTALTSNELGDRRIKTGDEVICVACAFPTTVTPIIQNGAVPVFVDVKLPEYNIDEKMLENAKSERTKAVFIAHTLGNPFNVECIKKFCDDNELWLIEDNCDSLGSEYKLEGRKGFCGSWGDISTCSFYPPHHITTGEGGAVCTNHHLLDRLVCSYRDWGRDCYCPSGRDNMCGHRFDTNSGRLPTGYDHKYVYSHLGYNLKMTDLQAAIGCAQLDKLPDFVKARKTNWKYLRSELDCLSDIFILPEAEKNSDPSWFGFALTIREEATIKRQQLIRTLEEKGIQTRMLFSGNITRHPCFTPIRDSSAYRVVGELCMSDYITENTFWIGVYPGMKEGMLEYMVDSIKGAVV